MNRFAGLMLAASLMSLTAAGPLRAQADPGQKVEFNIASQSLDRALNELAAQADWRIVFYPGTVAGLSAPSVVGAYTPEAALRLLLADSKLAYRLTDDRTIVVGGQLTSTAFTHTAAPIHLAQATASKDSETLEEVLIERTRFYQAPESSAAKIELPLLDTPQAVSVISADLIQAFGITDLKWISRYISGLDSRVTVVAENSDFTARGFTLDLEDGFKMNGFQYIPVQPIDTVAVERVEFLKGPSGILYGRNNYGGMLNYVTKQPENRDFTNLSMSVGGGDVELARAQMDINTALIDDTLLLRIPMAYELHDSYLDNDSKQFSAVPSLRWNASENVRVTLGGVLQHWRTNRQIGLSPVAMGATAEDVNWQDGNGLRCRTEGIVCTTPPSRLRNVFLGSDADFYDSTMTQFNAKVDYRINNRLNYFVSANQHRSTVKTQQHYIGTLIAEDGSAFMSRDAIAFIRESRGAETGFTGDFPLFGRDHKFYVGGDYRKYELNEFNNDDETLAATPINVLGFSRHDDYKNFLNANDLGRDWVPYQYLFDRDRKDWGLSAQVLFEIAEPFTLLLGGRYEKSQFTERYFELADGCFSTSCERTGADPAEVADSRVFLPRAGLTWKIVPDRWTAYASYTEGFIPQAGITRSGEPIDPETGHQIEVGLKGQLFDQRFLTTLALWQIQRDGVVIGDPNNLPGDLFVVGGLGQRNRGIEFEATGQITPALNVIVAASKTEGRFGRSSETLYSGKEVTSTPDYKYAVYFNYDFSAAPWQGLSLGTGFTTVGPQWGVFPAAFRVDGYTTMDVNLGYAFSERQRLSLQLQNLFDESYFLARGTTWEGCCGAFGDGRSVRVTFETSL